MAGHLLLLQYMEVLQLLLKESTIVRHNRQLHWSMSHVQPTFLIAPLNSNAKRATKTNVPWIMRANLRDCVSGRKGWSGGNSTLNPPFGNYSEFWSADSCSHMLPTSRIYVERQYGRIDEIAPHDVPGHLIRYKSRLTVRTQHRAIGRDLHRSTWTS